MQSFQDTRNYPQNKTSRTVTQNTPVDYTQMASDSWIWHFTNNYRVIDALEDSFVTDTNHPLMLMWSGPCGLLHLFSVSMCFYSSNVERKHKQFEAEWRLPPGLSPKLNDRFHLATEPCEMHACSVYKVALNPCACRIKMRE